MKDTCQDRYTHKQTTVAELNFPSWQKKKKKASPYIRPYKLKGRHRGATENCVIRENERRQKERESLTPDTEKEEREGRIGDMVENNTPMLS